MQLFHFQAQNNPIYRAYIEQPGIGNNRVRSLRDIPFLPISFFKTHTIKTGAWVPKTSFVSSGTTGRQASQLPVKDPGRYLHHAERCFEHFFGDLENYRFYALLPSYLERGNSSLVFMIDHFIKKSHSPAPGFYLNNVDDLLRDLAADDEKGRKPILWGVAFALLDLAERYHPDLSHCMVFETGGMKGRRQEIIRLELHSNLREAFGVQAVFSEYGMTELFSQAYSRGGSAFFCPPWMKIIARDITDPFAKGLLNETGGINVIDLANVDSIAFIETEDIGKVYEDGSFEILGRLDNTDVRGCNLMVQ